VIFTKATQLIPECQEWRGFMKDVVYFAPTGIVEAVKLLAEYGERATILAGGTDLVPKINYYELKPDILLYIGRLGLDNIKEQTGN